MTLPPDDPKPPPPTPEPAALTSGAAREPGLRQRRRRRRPGRVRRWVVRPFVWLTLLLLVLIASGVLFVNSRYARQSAADLLRGELADSLGREVAVASVDFDLWTLHPTFEIHGLEIPGPRPGEPAVLRAALARLRISWRALTQRRLQLEQVDLDRPQFYLRFNPDGTSNLPHWRRGASQGQRLQVSIDRVLVENGTFQLNERRARLDLTARAVWLRLAEPPPPPSAASPPLAPLPAAGARPALALDYLLTAQAVSITLPNARPYLLTLSVRGRVDGGHVQIAASRLSGPDLAMQVHGSISWAGDNQVDLGVTAQAASRWVNRVGYLDEPIDGNAAIDGRFTYRHNTWEYSGTLRAPRIHVLRRDFTDLFAGFRGGPQKLDVDVRHALHDQATLNGPVVIWTGAAAGPHGGRPVDLDLTIRGLALEPFLTDLFPAQFAGPEPPVVEIAGLASGRLRYRFQSSEWRKGTGETDLRVEAGQAAMAGGAGLPVAGEVPLRMSGGTLSGGAIQISAPGQEATVTGFAFSLERGDGHLDYRLVSQDTGALAPLFPPVEPRLPTAHWTGPRETLPIWLPNTGHGTAAGTVRIDVVGYSARVDLDLAAVVDHSLGAADHLHGTLTLEPLAVENLRLEGTAGQGALILSGRIPLAANGRATPGEPLDLAIDASQWPAAGLEPYLPAWFPVAGLRGEASGRIDLGGDFVHLTGAADAEIDDLAVAGLVLGRLRGQLSWDPARFALADGLLEAPAGKLLAHGSFDRAGGGIDLTLDSPALDLAGEPLAGRLHLPALAGRVALMAAIGGNLDRPRATLSLRGNGIAYDGRLLAGDAAGTAQVTVNWDGELVRASGTLGSLLAFDGGGKLDRRQAAIRLDLRSDRLANLLHLAVPGIPAPGAADPASPPAAPPTASAASGTSVASGASVATTATGASPLPAGVGTTALSGSLSGALTADADFAAARYHGELRLDSLRLGYAGHEIANREPVLVDITPQRLAIRSLSLGEAGADLEAFAFGSIGLTAAMPLDLRLQSSFSATWVKLFVPGVDFGGAVDLLASVRGTLSDPDLSGQAVLRDARVVLPTLATLDGVQGTLRFYRDRVVLDDLTGRLGGGTVRANGQLALPGAGRTTSYRLDLAAQGVSLRFPEGFVSRGDATLSLVGNGASRQLQGVVNLNRELYVQDLQVDPFVLVLRGLQRERVRVTPTSPLLAGTQMKLSILGPGALRVTNNVADLHGDIDLTVAGTLASPVIFGSVKLDQGGTLTYSDNKYQVERGTLTFANPNRVDPIIDLSLQTEVQSYQITLNLSGTLEKLNAKFSSNAELADIDILSLLASGSRPEIGAPPPPGPQSEAAGQAAASQFLAGQASSALGTRVGRLFGLDRFRVDTQTLTQAGEPTSGVVITAGKRLSKNIFITYVSNPSSPRLDVRQIEWTVAKNLTILLTQSDTSFAVDIQRETRF